jgi:peroxiredoxin
MKYIFVICIAILFFSCENENASNTLELGSWRAALTIDAFYEIPFTVTLHADTTMTFYNAEERVEISEIRLFGDSIYIEHPVFEGVFEGVFTEKLITGSFSKPSLGRIVPFIMVHGEESRFSSNTAPNTNITGNWETVFSPETEADRYVAKGIFEQSGAKVLGTFRTTTGDYRYLEGVLVGDTLKLSTFDGAHAFLFEAFVTDSTMVGSFFSGAHWKEPFVAKLNNTYELPSAESLTYIKEGYDALDFSFKDTNGTMVSLSDNRFKDKLVLVQIMGTWCPNCLDETKYFSQFYRDLNSDDFEIVSLAFEYAKTEASAMKAIKRLKKAIEVPYPILLAQYGTSSKQKANEKLPMLNHVLSYPTTLFLDKKGVVRKIHTGFNGPATGADYITFVKEFETYVNRLLEED